ncbi:MAG: hypothetical protein GQ574_15070 [Crocinitomix sp.]|nr:hypothetical protein [Crocinitomix sp.]
MKKLLMIAAVLLIAVACDKNQKAVKTLDGNWKATAFTVSEDGVTVDYLAFGFAVNMNFDACKLKDDEFCNMTTTFTFDGDTETESDVYRVTNDGERLEQKDDLASTSIDAIDIIELTKTSLILKMTDDGEVTDITFEKI